jgi:hypothetical protein
VQCLRSVSALTWEGTAIDAEEEQDHATGEALSQHTLKPSGSEHQQTLILAVVAVVAVVLALLHIAL